VSGPPARAMATITALPTVGLVDEARYERDASKPGGYGEAAGAGWLACASAHWRVGGGGAGVHERGGGCAWAGAPGRSRRPTSRSSATQRAAGSTWSRRTASGSAALAHAASTCARLRTRRRGALRWSWSGCWTAGAASTVRGRLRGLHVAVASRACGHVVAGVARSECVSNLPQLQAAGHVDAEGRLAVPVVVRRLRKLPAPRLAAPRPLVRSRARCCRCARGAPTRWCVVWLRRCRWAASMWAWRWRRRGTSGTRRRACAVSGALWVWAGACCCGVATLCVWACGRGCAVRFKASRWSTATAAMASGYLFNLHRHARTGKWRAEITLRGVQVTTRYHKHTWQAAVDLEWQLARWCAHTGQSRSHYVSNAARLVELGRADAAGVLTEAVTVTPWDLLRWDGRGGKAAPAGERLRCARVARPVRLHATPPSRPPTGQRTQRLPPRPTPTATATARRRRRRATATASPSPRRRRRRRKQRAVDGAAHPASLQRLPALRRRHRQPGQPRRERAPAAARPYHHHHHHPQQLQPQRPLRRVAAA
jgi:hypothetical protein